MPTTRRRRARQRRADLDPTLWAILTDAPLPPDSNPFLVIEASSYNYMLPLWEESRDFIMDGWVKEHPGTRPAMWWRYDAPRASPDVQGRWSCTIVAERMIDLRRKENGNGQPIHDVLAYVPSHDYGIPAWLGDPYEPPVFETQHNYLKRHGLLLSKESCTIAEPFPCPLQIEAARAWR